MQPTLSAATLPPATIVDALPLQVSGPAHRVAVQAFPRTDRTLGQAIAAAIDPQDLSLPLAAAPHILSADARMARILRGI